MPTITINNVVFDPEQALPAETARALAPRSAAETNYILVQTTHALNRAEKAQLRETGAEILEYVPEAAYICHYRPQALAPVQNLPFVSWAGPYLRDFKIEPALTRARRPGREERLAVMNEAGDAALTPEPQTVEVVFHQNVNPAMERQRIAELAHTPIDAEAVGTNKVRVTAAPAAIAAIANLDTVRHIEKVLPDELFNDQARAILRMPTSNPPVALTGAGQVVAVADTGFDNGKSNHTVHPAFRGRVRRLYALGRPGTGTSPANADDPHGHGTHVAGSVLGDGTMSGLGTPIQGTAPGAELVLQGCYKSSTSTLGGLPASLANLFGPPYIHDGARIHSNSWGTPNSAGSYTQRSYEVDDFVFKNRDCLIIFAAGNDGVDSLPPNGEVDKGSVTAPGTAKNCLTVGASENYRSNPFSPHPAPVSLTWNPPRWPHAPINGDNRADNPDGMAAFSGRGPTRHKRLKPDVVAPGTFVLSTRSRHIAAVHAPSAPSSDPDYYFSSGTSMATPLVAGCAAVLREWLASRHEIASPSAALLKALLINGARDIAGQYLPSEAPAIPNPSEGFGRVDMAATITDDSASASTLTFLDEATDLDAGEAETQTIEVPADATLLKVTLVWTDPPNAGLQNDLDLIVRDALGNECHGNKVINDPDFDRDNNVEQVLWDRPAAGRTTITVRATRITLIPQSYALVIRVN